MNSAQEVAFRQHRAAQPVPAMGPGPWRESVASGTLTVFAIVAPVLAALGLFVRSTHRGPQDLIPLITVGLLLPALRLKRSLPVRHRATVGIVILFGAAFLLIARFGFAAGLSVLVVVTCVLAVIVLGRTAGFAMIAAAGVAYVTIGVLVGKGVLRLAAPEVDPLLLRNWVRLALSTSLQAALLGSVVHFVIRHVETNARATTKALDELRAAYDALRESEERYRSVIDHCLDGVLLTKPSGETLEANPAICRILGRTAEEICSLGRDGIADPEDPRVARLLEQRRQSGSARGEITMLRGDGTKVPVEISSAVFRDRHGELRTSMSVRDLTDRKRTERDLLEADRRKDEFLAMLGHELRNPLAPIVIAIELMKMNGPGVMEEERAIIERQAKHLTRLVDDLLDVSRITRARIELRRAPTDLKEIVARAVEMASPLLEQRAHRLTIDVPADLIIDADPARMVQVVTNLLTNAATYTDPGGLIRVTGEGTEETVTLRVTDNGVGISPATLPFVFDLFVQEKQALDRARGGLGLGLAIVKSLVELHGGSVSARSEGPGTGSEFAFSLARSSRNEQPPVGAARATDSAGAGTRILIVDDNDDMARAFAAALAALGHEVRTAHDGPQALRIVEEFTPTVALLDIGLPIMDGYELARRLREIPRLSSIRLIAVSGYGESPAVQRSSEAGFEEHLIKPVQVDVIDKMVRAGVNRTT